MKKSTIFVLLMLVAVMLGITMAASAASKDAHWATINNALNELEAALDRGNKKQANSALADVRAAVYAGMKDMAGDKYDSRALEIINYATQAMTSADFHYLLTQAHFFNNLVFGDGVTGGASSDSSIVYIPVTPVHS